MVIAFTIYLLYTIWSVESNYRRIQRGTVTGQKSIKHIYEDILQGVGTIILCWAVKGFTLEAIFLCIALFAFYWLIFDWWLNIKRGLHPGYRSKACYDQLLPGDFYLQIIIKSILIVGFTYLATSVDCNWYCVKGFFQDIFQA